MPPTGLVLVGFGNVGQALARLLLAKRELLQAQYGITFQVNGILTGRHGSAIDPSGLDLEQVLERIQRKEDLSSLSAFSTPADLLEWIRACPGDVLFENTPVNPFSGQPSIAYLRAGLEQGMHAITANKGPVVHAHRELTALAAAQGKRFLFESAVMDGAPIFSLFRGPLPAAELRGFTGILNSTTNLILAQIEAGMSFEQAVVHCQALGLAETNPSMDVDGWDAAVKVAALANVLMGADLTPAEVQRTGIREVTPAMIAEARGAGERWKLVCSVRRSNGEIQAEVAPKRVGPGSVLYAIKNSSSYVEFELDVLPGLGIVENNPGPDTTAYGLLADLINTLRGA